METATNYQKQAIDFLKKHSIKFSGEYVEYGYHFEGDKDAREIYLLKLKRKGRQISFRFGQSIASAGEMPAPYDLLACVQKYDPGTFEIFCSDFGYDEDSRKAEKVYKGVIKEWKKVESFFTASELEELQEIN